MPTYHPRSYRRYQERRTQADLAAAARLARRKRREIADALEERADAISEEGRAFLESMGKFCGVVERVARGR